ncbi:MAG: hypothetical protein M1833_004321 [Piccolia ochrophora]|nr:MAG: hypothetical protein M1833_004321 [Piccolia ochrophora]
MTEVLSAPLHRDQSSYFSSSQSSLLSRNPYSRQSIKDHPRRTEFVDSVSHSAPSSAPSSPYSSHHGFPQSPAYSSTPSSSLSLNSKCEDEEDDGIVFPTYDDVGFFDQTEKSNASASVRSGSSNVAVPEPITSSSTPQPRLADSPRLAVTAEDDTAVHDEPSRHVDYLSHDWREEDIWASWRHIVSKRKTYGNSARLENASWRSWAKAKYRLKTVSPETLNWFKDCDVTWLYGPLQTGSTKSLAHPTTPAGSRLSKNNSFFNKKPILKKRSMSEIMLQRSISASSLLKQAAAAVQAQQSSASSDRICGRPGMGRAASDFVSSTFASGSPSSESTSADPSASSSGIQTPGGCHRRHIHFNDKVEQCIAVDGKYGEEDDEEEDSYEAVEDDESSDDGLVMMKPSSKAKTSNRTTPRNSFSSESKTIALLPATTLKYRSDTPELPDAESKRSNGFWNSSKLSPSPSQETLRPSKASGHFLLDEEDEDMSWEPAGAFRSPQTSSLTGQGATKNDAEEDEHSGLRRTPSGMFMPYEEDEDDVVANGLFGKVVDTVNTARDIAHVIWNVGWRR